MIEAWLPFFQWCEASGLGQVVRESTWLFPVLEAIHLLGLCALGGTVLLVDLALLGLGLSRTAIDELAAAIYPWMLASLGLMVATGIPLFLSEATKCFYNPSFWVKMAALPLALSWALVVRRRVARRAGGGATVTTRIVALVSIALWFTVAAAGRWIGFSS